MGRYPWLCIRLSGCGDAHTGIRPHCRPHRSGLAPAHCRSRPVTQHYATTNRLDNGFSYLQRQLKCETEREPGDSEGADRHGHGCPPTHCRLGIAHSAWCFCCWSWSPSCSSRGRHHPKCWYRTGILRRLRAADHGCDGPQPSEDAPRGGTSCARCETGSPASVGFTPCPR